MEASEALRKVDGFLERLASPIADDLAQDGWTDECAEDIRTRLEEFRHEIEVLGSLPPVARRPLNMVRFLDFCGVQKGQLLRELAQFENALDT